MTFYTKDNKTCGDYEIIIWDKTIEASLIFPQKLTELIRSKSKTQGYTYQEADAYNQAMNFSELKLERYKLLLEDEGFSAAKRKLFDELRASYLVPTHLLQRFREAKSSREFQKVLETQVALDADRSIGFILRGEERTFSGLVSSMPLGEVADNLYNTYLVLCDMNHTF